MTADTMTAEEEVTLALTVMARVLERAPEGSYGMTLEITQFGNLMLDRHGKERLAMRQTLTFDTADGRYYCVADGRMMVGEHLLFFDDFLQMKGVVRVLATHGA